VTSNDPAALEAGKGVQYSCFMHESGGIVDDCLVYRVHDTDRMMIVVNASNIAKDWNHINQYAKKFAVKLTNKSDETALLAIQGPKTQAALQPLTKTPLDPIKFYNFTEGEVAGVKCIISRTGYTGEDGFEVMLPKEKVEEFWYALNKVGVKPIGLGARDTLRLEAGMNLYGQDMDESISPLEAGMAWTVDLKSPRDFIGKAALLANPPTRKLIGLVLLDRGVLRGHQRVHTAQGEGEITSGTFSPTLEKSIALARVPNGVQIGDTVQVAIRDKMLAAQVVKYPFARNGKGLI
jgi:aminomethyltransferase